VYTTTARRNFALGLNGTATPVERVDRGSEVRYRRANESFVERQ
jgi:hypothetical protein